jgi:hypothetical protein
MMRRLLRLGAVGSAVVGGSFLHPVVAGTAGQSVPGVGPIGTGLVAPAVAMIALALALGGASILVESDRDLATRRNAERTARVVGAVLVVGAAIAGTPGLGMVGTASATFGFQDCNPGDSLVGAFIQSFVGPNQADRCRFNPADPSIDPANVTQADAYASGLSMRESSKTFIAQSQNTVQMVNSTAWLEAKVALVNALQNNTSVEVARQRAVNASDEPIAATQENILRDYSERSQTLAYWGNNTPSDTVWYGNPTGGIQETDTVRYRLATGDNITFQAFVPNGASDGYNVYVPTDERTEGTNRSINSLDGNAPGSTGSGQYVKIKDGLGNTTRALNPRPYGLLLEDTHRLDDRIEANVKTYVNKTYEKVNNGTLNISDVAASSPTALASQASTDRNSSGYYAYSNAALASLSADGNLSASHLVRTTQTRFDTANGTKVYDNRTVNISGTLFYTGSDAPTLATGSTINPADYSGAFVMTVSTLSSNGSEVNTSQAYYNLNRNFTILNATNTKTGEELNETRLTERDYTSRNASNLTQDLETAGKTRDYYADQQTGGAGGIFDSNGDGEADPLILVYAAGAAGVLLIGLSSISGGDRQGQ